MSSIIGKGGGDREQCDEKVATDIARIEGQTKV